MDKETLSLLELIASRDHVTISDLDFVCNTPFYDSSEPLEWLLDNGYVCHCDGTTDMSPESMFCITYEGKVYLRNRKSSDRHSFLKEFRAWSTLAIALAAFVKSFFF